MVQKPNHLAKTTELGAKTGWHGACNSNLIRHHPVQRDVKFRGCLTAQLARLLTRFLLPLLFLSEIS
jgi:hypothetical protein